jgi:hypothetical protein
MWVLTALGAAWTAFIGVAKQEPVSAWMYDMGILERVEMSGLRGGHRSIVVIVVVNRIDVI